jgi:hypothetical protein
MSASKKSSSKHRPSQREGEAGKQQRHRDKRDRTSSSSSQIMRQGEGGGDGISNGGHHPYVHTNHNNLRGGSSRNINTPLHSPASPNSTTDNDFTDTDTDFSPDHREERYHRTKSPDGAQSVSSRTVRSHKTTASSLVTRSRNNNNTNRIHDDSVQLDLPMADLMAYLQVVANNSSNLPLTRRDDPELGRTVSSLTSEEYALKCAAFIPANVRILGGMYGKYGSVWDLPTSEVSLSWYGCHCYYMFLYLLNNCNCLLFTPYFRSLMSQPALANLASPTEGLAAMPSSKPCTTLNPR